MSAKQLISSAPDSAVNIFRLLYAVIIVAALLNLGSCFKEPNYAPNSQEFCEPCNEDVDCCCNLKCLPFYNKSGVYSRCATRQTDSCPQ